MASKQMAQGCGLLLVLAGCAQKVEYFDPPPESSPPEVAVDAAPAPPAPSRLGTVINAAKTPPAISGGTLAVSQDGALAVAADPDRDAVHVIDLKARKTSTIQLDAGSEPGRVALDAGGRAHVALRSAGKLVSIDLKAAKVIDQTDVCALPRGVAYDQAGDQVLVACASGDLVALSADTHAERSRAFIERDLRDVVMTTKGDLYVTRYRSAELLKVALSGSVLKRITPPAQSVTRFSFSNNGGSGERQVTMSPVLAWRALAANNGDVVMLHQRSQEEEVIPGPGGYGGNCESITQGAVTSMSDKGTFGVGMPLSDSTLSVDAALSPSGHWVAVAAPGSFLQGRGTVNLYRASAVIGQDGSADPGPGSCGFGEVSTSTDSQATAVAFDAKGNLYVQSREPAQLDIYQLDEFTDSVSDVSSLSAVISTATIPLDLRSARDTGHDLFHSDVGGGIACASCHGEGLDDGHVWTFKGIGPRRTQNIRGGLLETAPFHWDGDMTNFQHLVDEVMTKRMSGFIVEPRFADTLAQWIDTQPALKLQSPQTEAVERGRQLFESNDTQCTSCHSGAAFTNNASFDVGTGGKFQVPSLRGLGLRAPFMHDGCASTLAGRFSKECGGGDKHGKISQLSSAQIADMVSYLETL